MWPLANTTQAFLTSMNIVVNFEMRYVRKHPTTDLALIKLLLACLDSTVGRMNPHVLVYVLTVALLMNHIVPVCLETFTTHLYISYISPCWGVTFTF